MNARYLLDTSAATYAITKKSLAFDHHLAKVPMAEIGVSTVTEAELRYGLARRPSPALQVTIDTFLLAVTFGQHGHDDCGPCSFAGTDSHIKRCGVQTDQASEGRRLDEVIVG